VALLANYLYYGKEKNIDVRGNQITILEQNEVDYISLTDMKGSFKEGSELIGKLKTNKNTLEYLGIWEKINNPDFNYPEFGVIELYKLLNYGKKY
jgi:hypothetical protein